MQTHPTLPLTGEDIRRLACALLIRVKSDEEALLRSDKGANSLSHHLERVARLAERLGRAEGIEPLTCRLAGLFHDAGKFSGGRYHEGDRPEEELSVAVLEELTRDIPIEPSILAEVSAAIRELYRGEPEPSPLMRVLFDADNLDKLGPLGVANYFIKSGLRGGGLSRELLSRLTVELTYARYAPSSLMTALGRKMAEKRANETIAFIHALLDQLRDDLGYELSVEPIHFNALIIDAVEATTCTCGGKTARNLWEVPGMKCEEIHLAYSCAACGLRNELKFCRPRLMNE